MDFYKEKWLIATVVFAIVSTLIVSSTLGSYKGLPSPIYGGDYYYQLGQIYHMYEAPFLEWFGSSNGIGERPGYSITYGLLVTVFGKVLGLSPLMAMMDFNYLLITASCLMVFFLVRKVSGNDAAAFICTLILVPMSRFPLFKYTDFTAVFLFPAFLYAFYLFFKEQNLKNAVILAVAYGVMALAHSTGFFVTSFLIGGLILLKGWEKWKEKKLKLNLETVKEFRFHFLAFFLGLLIALIYWFGPIFIYHGSAPMKNHIWSQPDLANTQVMISSTIGYLSMLFFSISSVQGIVVSALLIYSIYLVWKKEEKDADFLAFVLVATVVLNFSYIITVPLMDTHLIPGYVSWMYMYPAAVLFSTIGMRKVLGMRYGVYAAILFAAVLLFSQYGAVEAQKTDQWAIAGMAGMSDVHASIQDGIMQNTNVDDVILTTNENGFMLNAITGRKLVVSRRSQNDPFVDFDKLQLDAAVMLYGNNLEKRKELMQEYGVDYVYWDFYWPSSEFSFNEQGQITGMYDPLIVVDTPENRAYLEQNGVTYASFTGWIDPSIKGPEIRTYDLLVVTPQNYDVSGKGPWDDGIDPYLEKVWSHSEGGQEIAILYKVNLG